MPIKKRNNKKGGFSLAPITLSEPVKITDGFTNLVDAAPTRKEATTKAEQRGDAIAAQRPKAKNAASASRIVQSKPARSNAGESKSSPDAGENQDEKGEESTEDFKLNEAELLRILGADSVDEIYELTDVLRASSLKLYAALVGLADARGRARVKNHELMSKAGIKGIATLYKQERWLTDLKLLEKKAKPGPHDGSSYVVHKLERLPLPAEIYEKFAVYLSDLNID